MDKKEYILVYNKPKISDNKLTEVRNLLFDHEIKILRENLNAFLIKAFPLNISQLRTFLKDWTISENSFTEIPDTKKSIKFK